MLVGIMSDSHGDAVATARAVDLLRRLGAKKLFHCGDICSDSVLAELADDDCTFVWGNCDDATPAVRRFVDALDLDWPEMPVEVEIEGKRIGLRHGHEPGFNFHPPTAGLDYLFHGHTHELSHYRDNGCRVISPGALHRVSVKTVATLDLDTDELRYYCIDTGKEVDVVEGSGIGAFR